MTVVSHHDIHKELEALKDANLSIQAHAEELLQDLQQHLETQTEAAEAAADANHQLREHLYGLFVRESAFHGKQIQDCQDCPLQAFSSEKPCPGRLGLSVARLAFDVESLVVKDCTTGTLSQPPLSLDAASVGLSSSAVVYCSKTSDPQQETPPTFRLDASSSQRTQPNERSRQFFKLPVSEKAKIYRLPQILDRYYISDAAYHEVTMAFPDLPMPKSYPGKQSRADRNNLTTLNIIDHGNGADTNGSSSSGIGGARNSLKEAIALEISLYLSEHPNEDAIIAIITAAQNRTTRHQAPKVSAVSESACQNPSFKLPPLIVIHKPLLHRLLPELLPLLLLQPRQAS